MNLTDATIIANNLKAELAPHCERIEIAGSIRRMKPEVGDIEIVCIPKPYQTGLFEDGIATVINKYAKVKGDLPCKYTQRILPEGIKADIFFAVPENWGYIYAIRTGSAEFSYKVLATTWKKLGYEGQEGFLTDKQGKRINVYSESELFRILSLAYVEPQNRN